MKLSHISIGILLVSVFVAPSVQAQTPAADSHSAVSSAGVAASGAVQSAGATAEVPRLIKFSGTLLDMQERPVAGPVGVTFALYARQTGGPTLWLETQNVKPDVNGNYTVLLGAASANGVPTELFTSAEARWLGIQVGQEPEQARILLVSVPYALKAKDAETLGGLPASAFVTTETLAGAGSSTGAVIPAATSGAAIASALTAQTTSSTQSTTKKSSVQPTSSTSSFNTATGTLALANITTGASNTANGFGALTHDTIGSSNTANGAAALFFNTTGNSNTASGEEALFHNTTGTNNTANGVQALIDNTTGTNNTAIGVQALEFNTTGFNNTASGYFALANNSTGGNNTANGLQALMDNTTGADNTASGEDALQSNTTGVFNTASGTFALERNTTGSSNTASGSYALFSNTTGMGNTASGFQAGFTANSSNANITGSNNTFIGFNSGPGTTNQLNNATAIGANALVSASNSMVLGDGTVNVGIGTQTPGAKLDVTGANIGVRGSANGGSGTGVLGSAFGQGGVGVAGQSPIDMNSGIGVFGSANNVGSVAGQFGNESGGNILIGTGSAVAKVFRVDGTGKVFANGGFACPNAMPSACLSTGSADFAEAIESLGQKKAYEPGDVLIIDSTGKRRVALASEPYSTRVAGIYSTTPAVLGGADNEETLKSRVPLAMVGIVPCRVTTENGPIVPGDLLVTSSTPGHAMKGTDRQRMLGAVVGKALEPFAKEAGVIQVLVTLQ